MRYRIWFTGAAVAALVALLAGTALSVLFLAVMLVSPWLALGLLALGTAGAVPALVVFRTTPVARWFCAGGALAVVIAWLALILAMVNGLAG